MLYIIILSITILLTLIFTFVFLLKQNSYNAYNFFIFISIIIMWIPVFIIVTEEPHNIFNLTQSELPILLSIYPFLQMIWRIPLGLLSRMLKSRTIVLQLVLVLLIIFSLSAFLLNDEFSPWLLIVGASFLGSTYGLQNQYHVENFDLSKVFRSVSIIIMAPMISKLISLLITAIFLKLNSISINWIFLLASLLPILPLIGFIIVHENKSTIKLHIDLPDKYKYDYKFKNAVTLALKNAIMSLVASLILNGAIFKIINAPWDAFRYFIVFAPIVSTFLSIYIIRKLLVLIELIKLKYILSIFMIVSILIALGGVLLESWIMSVVGLIIFIMSFMPFHTLLFGTIQHADHKNPELILGIYLTVNSFGYGWGAFISRFLSSQVSFNNNDKAIIIFSIALAIICAFFIFQIFEYKINKKIYTLPIKYEFQNINRKIYR